MKAIVEPSAIKGTINAPPSKSITQRACAAALLAKGETVLKGIGRSDDELAAISIIRDLGAVTKWDGDELIIKSAGISPVANDIYCGESGLSLRMFSIIGSLHHDWLKFEAGGSLRSRPVGFLKTVLPQLSVQVEDSNGFPPINVKGPLDPGNISVDGSMSSQFVTGLLMAYSASGAADVTVKVKNAVSTPYIDLTLELMRDFGMKLPSVKEPGVFYFPASGAVEVSAKRSYTISGDWSAAAILLVAGAIAGSISIKGLDSNSAQADKRILEALRLAGATVAEHNDMIEVSAGMLRAFEFDAIHCPDLFPPLAVLAAFCSGESILKGAGRLLHKESNRAFSLQEELSAMSVKIELDGDEMKVRGGEKLNVKEREIHSHGDHRIAMACAVAALRADGPVTISGAESVSKSYPEFWQQLQKAGASVSLTDHHN